MSVFKKYDINKLDTLSTFKKKLYFPNSNKILHYDKKIDTKLFNFINKLVTDTLYIKSNN